MSGDANLAVNVADLSTKAEKLAEALLTVDQNARELIRLQLEMDDKMSKNDVALEVSRLKEQSRLDRLRVKSIAFSASVLAAAIVGASVFGLLAYTQSRDAANTRYATVTMDICEERTKQNDALRTFFAERLFQVQNDPDITEKYRKAQVESFQDLVDRFERVDCSVLKPQASNALAG